MGKCSICDTIASTHLIFSLSLEMPSKEMRSSYIDAASALPDDYLNTRIIVLGCWLNDVPAGETATGEEYLAFTQLLLKISETDKKERNVIIRTSARQALSDAEIWLKCF